MPSCFVHTFSNLDDFTTYLNSYVWSWTKVSIDFYSHLTHTLLEFWEYLPRVGSLSIFPLNSLSSDSWSILYPHLVSMSLLAWYYFASTHANTSVVKQSGLASLPKKSQAASNGAILLGQVAATFLSAKNWNFCLCPTRSVSRYVCIHSQFIPQAVYTHIHWRTYIFVRAISRKMLESHKVMKPMIPHLKALLNSF